MKWKEKVRNLAIKQKDIATQYNVTTDLVCSLLNNQDEAEKLIGYLKRLPNSPTNETDNMYRICHSCNEKKQLKLFKKCKKCTYGRTRLCSQCIYKRWKKHVATV